jgi:hypothetical protein
MKGLITLLGARQVRRRTIALTALLVLVAGAVAVAAPGGLLTPGGGGPQPGLTTAGPVSPSNGFPDWYRDVNGVDLAPCDNAQDPNCGGAVPTPDPTAPTAFPDNYPDEFFYQQATADGLVSAGGNNVLAEFDLEGAFASGPVTQGDQIVFSRIRYKITGGLKPDTDYKVTHPYGTDTVHTDPGETSFFVTQDVGVAAGDFNAALKGRVGPFLRWDPAQTPAPPTGYVGDGVTPHRVIGSDLGTNFVRVTGPGIGGAVGATNPNPCNTTGANAWTGAVNDCIQTPNFVLVGKLQTNGGVDVPSATYSRATDSAGNTKTQLSVLATSKAAQDIVVQDADTTPNRLFRSTALRGDGARYAARVTVPGTTLPKQINVINRGDTPTTTKTVDVTDQVTASAVYHMTAAGGDQLHVTATSSDQTLDPTTLQLPEFANKALGTNGQVDVATDAPPATVTVKSTTGHGSVTVPVVVDGDSLNPLDLIASAGGDMTVESGAKVNLDGSGSTGDIDGYSWSETTDSGVTINTATSANASFTAPKITDPAGKTLTFKLTVAGPGGPVTDTVDVKVKALAPPKAAITAVGGLVPQNLALTLDGSTSTGAATYEWTMGDGTKIANVTGTTNTTSKLTFLFPKTSTNMTIRLRVRSADDPGGTTCNPATCDTATIELAPLPDLLQNIVAKNDGKGRWVVSGTSTVLISNNVKVHSGGINGPVIGTALVDPTGAWKIDVRNSTVPVPPSRTVSVESDRGGQTLNAPMQ